MKLGTQCVPNFLVSSSSKSIADGFIDKAKEFFSRVFTVGLARLFFRRYINWREIPALKACRS